MEFFSRTVNSRRPDKSDPEAVESKRLLEEFSGGQAEYAKNAKINYLFRDGKQFTSQELTVLGERAHAAISWNMVHPLIENLKAILTANQPRFQAIGVEDSDGRMADLVSNILEYIWFANAGKQQYEYHVDDFSVGGMGVWLAWSDPTADGGRGEVHFRSIDPMKVYIDPASTDRYGRDAQHILISEQYSASQVLNFYGAYIDKATLGGLPHATASPTVSPELVYKSPEDIETLTPSTRFSGSNKSTDTQEPTYEIIERYSMVRVERFELVDNANKRRKYFASQAEREFDLVNMPVVLVDGRPISQMELVNVYKNLAQGQQPDPVSGQFLAHYALDPASGQPVLAPGHESQGDPEVVIPGTSIGFTISNGLEALGALEFEGLVELASHQLNRVKRVISIDHTLLHSEVLEVSQLPVIPVMNRHNRSPYPKGHVDFIRGLQRYYNKLQSLVLAHTANITSPKLLVPRGTDVETVNEQMSRAGFGTVEVDMEFGAPLPIQIPSLSGQVFELLQNTELKMKQIVGVYDLMAGDSSAAPTTYYATMAIEEFGQRRMRSTRDVVEHGLTLLGQVMMELAQDTYSENKIIRVFDPNFESRAESIQLNQPIYDEYGSQLVERVFDISTIKCDVRIISGSTLPSNRWARFEQMKELYNLGVVDQVALLKEADIPDRDHIIERMGIMQQLQQQLAQAQEEIAKLKGDQQTADRELLHARQRTELEKFKSNLKSGEVQAMRANDKIVEDTRRQAEGFMNELTAPATGDQQLTTQR